MKYLRATDSPKPRIYAEFHSTTYPCGGGASIWSVRETTSRRSLENEEKLPTTSLPECAGGRQTQCPTPLKSMTINLREKQLTFVRRRPVCELRVMSAKPNSAPRRKIKQVSLLKPYFPCMRLHHLHSIAGFNVNLDDVANVGPECASWKTKL